MARKRKKKAAIDWKDDRIAKLLGVFSILIASYLFIAFTSYIFTWEEDQSLVHQSHWSLLSETAIEMDNWLGRLGAIVSDLFIYWGFGIPSFIFVALLGILGWNTIQDKPLKDSVPFIRNSVLLLIFLSVFLAAIFASSPFSWGGAFGGMVSDWLYNFVGSAGLILLFLAFLVGLFIWNMNPNFSEMTMESAMNDSREYFYKRFLGERYRPAEMRDKKTVKTLRPKKQSKDQIAASEKAAIGAAKTDDSGALIVDDKGQVALSLKDRLEQKKKAALKVGEGELEIEMPKVEEAAPVEKTPEGDLPGPSVPVNSHALEKVQESDQLEPYDPTLELPSYENPVLALLEDYAEHKQEINREELENKKDQIIETLLHYKIEITSVKAVVGPTVTLFKVKPAPGVRISKIKNLEDDIALSLSALGIRIIAPIPGEGVIGIEVPNEKKAIVSLKESLGSEAFKRSKMQLPIAFGKTIDSKVFVADLSKMPHLLIAGATGQGKSVGINVILMSLLYRKHPSQMKLVLIDPKKVELFPYSQIDHHFLAFLPGSPEPITTETNKVVHTLNSLCIEMDQRYNLLKKASVRNIKEYNEKFIKRRLSPTKGHRFLPFIVLVIDEFADLIMTAGKEVELPIGRLAQLARAVGIHLVIATQRPSVNIITGVIKANFPARIAFKVTSKVDSRTILDGGGADQLIGRGDMLLSVGGDMIRLQCAFVDTPEVEKVLKFISEQRGYPEPHFLPEFHGDDAEIQGSGGLNLKDLDDKFEDAARLIVGNQHGSTSMIQRRLSLGYNRAGRIMDQLEALGIVGPNEGSKPREVLVYDEIELDRYLEDLRKKKNS
ncbi:MAG: DNA translocase FtsK [Bacteroidota bacterium]